MKRRADDDNSAPSSSLATAEAVDDGGARAGAAASSGAVHARRRPRIAMTPSERTLQLLRRGATAVFRDGEGGRDAATAGAAAWGVWTGAVAGA